MARSTAKRLTAQSVMLKSVLSSTRPSSLRRAQNRYCPRCCAQLKKAREWIFFGAKTILEAVLVHREKRPLAYRRRLSTRGGPTQSRYIRSRQILMRRYWLPITGRAGGALSPGLTIGWLLNFRVSTLPYDFAIQFSLES